MMDTTMQSGPTGLIMPLATQRGGCETMLLNLLHANHLTAGHDYRLCFLEDGPMVGRSRLMGYDTVVISAGRLRQPLRFAGCVFRLARWMRDQRLRQAVSFMEKAHLYASPAGVLARVPTAWWLHSISPDSRMMQLIARLPSNHVFSDSKAALDLLNPKWKHGPSTVCHCAVDRSRFDPTRLPSPAEAKRKLGLDAGRPVVGVVARLQRWKGVDVFIRAAARLVEQETSATFIVVGGEHDLEPGVKPELDALIGRLHLHDRLKLVGYQEDVPLWMQAMDVIVHCSTGIEPFGTVIVEAMALGKPVVAAGAGGPLEIIEPGFSGLLTPPGDDNALAVAITSILADPRLAARLGEMGKTRAEKFSADRLATELQEALGRLASGVPANFNLKI